MNTEQRVHPVLPKLYIFHLLKTILKNVSFQVVHSNKIVNQIFLLRMQFKNMNTALKSAMLVIQLLRKTFHY